MPPTRRPSITTFKRAADIHAYVVSKMPDVVGVRQVADALGLTPTTVYNTIYGYPEVFIFRGSVVWPTPNMPSWFALQEMREDAGPDRGQPYGPVAQRIAADENAIPVAEYTREQAKTFAHRYDHLVGGCHGLLWMAVYARAAAMSQPLDECRSNVVTWLRQAADVVEADTNN